MMRILKAVVLQGDSGSALTDENGILIGITSFGTDPFHKCKRGQNVYADVYRFLDFIEDTVPHVLLL